MKRRKFLLTGESTILASASLSSQQRSAVGLEFELSSVSNISPSNVNSVLIDFNTFKLTPRYLDNSENISITIDLTLDGIDNKIVEVDVPVEKQIDRSSISSNLPISVDNINTTDSSISGNIEITLEHSSLGTKSYDNSFSISNSTPVADITAPSDVGVDESFNLDGGDSTDPNGDTLAYSWDLDSDGAYEKNGGLVTHSYSSSGDRTVKLLVEDGNGGSDTATTSISVNDAPSASFSFSPTSPSIGDQVSFDASGSGDPDGSISSYEWDFGDDSTSTGENPTHTYNSNGSYDVTLTVTDNDGSTDVTTSSVSVNDSPTADFSFSPTSPATGDQISFDASDSSDEGSIASYDWDFGDGTSATGSNPDHSYDSSGTYTVSLTVTDDDGATSIKSVDIDINSPPIADFSFSPTDPFAGDQVSFDASNSSDNGSISSYDWDFGDGATGTGKTPNHTYSSDGSYTITLTITDDDGATDNDSTGINVDSVFEDGFEGSFSSEWDQTQRIKTSTSKSKSGSYSAYAKIGSNTVLKNNLSGKTPSTIGYSYNESSDAVGVALKIYGSDGDLIEVIGSSNPNFEMETANPSGGSYNSWHTVRLYNIDWSNGSFNWEMDSDSGSSNFYKSSANSLGRIEFSGYNWNNGGSSDKIKEVYIDDVFVK